MRSSSASELPSSWAYAKISDIADVNPKLVKSDIDDDFEVSFVPMSCVEALSGRIDLKSIRRISEVSKGYTPFKEGDVLFAKITPCMENGKMAIVPALRNGHGFGSTEFHVLRPFSGVSASYLYYFVSSQKFRNDAEHNMTGGVGQRRVPTTYLSEQRIPVPPQIEQNRIVAKIEELFSELNRGVDVLATAREQLVAYRKAVLKYSFEGAITSDWRAEHKNDIEAADVLLQRISQERTFRYKKQLAEWESAVLVWKNGGEVEEKPLKPRKLNATESPAVDNGPSLPKEWRWARVSEFADLVTDGTHHTPTYTSSGVPFISVKDIYDGAVHFEECKFISKKEHDSLIKRCKPEPGDLLITKSGTIGRLAVVPEKDFSLFVSVALIKIQSAKAHISSRWLRYAFEHHIMGLNIDQDIKGGLLKNYHLEDLRLAKMPLCSYVEQEALADVLDEKLTLADSFTKTLEEELGRIESLRQSILESAFSGKLVAQDLQDEPASVLLERIRAEDGEEKARKRRNNKNGKKEPA